jgi:maltose alpha-D-glucosyltransferase/alpha-amylase
MPSGFESDPLWYKDAIIYEVHVRAFYDSDGDGMGDFRGLSSKLDYLQDLGVTAIWLLPFFPSPWRDDGYDISDYTEVHPTYGTLRDFQHFLREARKRGLRVITEVVVNHTSDQHPWFQRARKSPPGSRWRDYYVWSDTADKYKEARIIFKDFETSNWTWDPVAKAYYWHRFYSHQPDLNYDNPHVRESILDVIDFWLDLGVDAFRLDAIPYLVEREGTNCENLPETHAFLKEIRRHIDSKYPDKMILAEANQWPEDAIAYFGAGDECHMAFHFPLMPRLFMATRMEDRFPVIEILQQTPPIPPTCQWATFLRNHDELTLEMVTDEERDYMYRVYAHDRQMRINLGIRRRLAPLLGNDRRRIELMKALLFSLPGTPVLYYGDEIGMGDNIYLGDRNGVRTPMQWSADRNGGFSRANPQRLYLPVTIDPEYHYEAINVEAQQNNPNSLLWWTKRLIEQRTQHKAFGRGTLEFLQPANRKVLAFHRRYEDENILVVANLSRFPQHAGLDLSRFRGMKPVEMFGRAEFPVIGEGPYAITLGAHNFYWFSLESRPAVTESIAIGSGPQQAPVILVDSLLTVYEGRALEAINRLVANFLRTRRWFLGQHRTIRDVDMLDIIPVPGTTSTILLCQVEYGDGDPEVYVLTAAIATGPAIEEVKATLPDTIFVRLRTPEGSEALMYSAIWSKSFADALLNAMARRRRFRSRAGELAGSHTREFRAAWGPDHPRLEPAALRVEQSNNSIVYGDRFILKIFRRAEPGQNPDIEIGAHLTRLAFPHVPKLTGTIEYRPEGGEPMQVAMLQNFVPNQGSGWQYTLDALSQYFEAALARPENERTAPAEDRHPLNLRQEPLPHNVRELLGAYPDAAELLGRRTAELHLALAQADGNPDFEPQPFTDHYRLGIYHRMLGSTTRILDLLRQRLPDLRPEVRSDAEYLLQREEELRAQFRPIRDRRITATRIRAHGDLHLNQILHTGKDFVFIDFEGELSRPLSERRIKRSALRDVASMLCSFQYAANAVLFGHVAGVTPRPDGTAWLESWASAWYAWVSAQYLKGYLTSARHVSFVPASEEELRLLLDAYLLEEAIDELGHDLADRPDWARIPLRGILARLRD